jgi:4-hydroxy-tetrahydrodipicolinate reductase
MGKEIEGVCTTRGHEVSFRIDPAAADADAAELKAEHLHASDVAVEFSLAAAVSRNAELYASCEVPAVVGTTGWDADREAVKALFDSKGAYLWGSNFSIGAHVFFALAEKAAELVSQVPEYDLLAYEIHHAKKADSPSGTALTLASKLVNANQRKKRIVTERLDRAIEPDELHLASLRGGSIPGVHTVLMDSAADTIEIKHTARNRGGFALGAVMAAEWLSDKKGYHEVTEFMSDLLEST